MCLFFHKWRIVKGVSWGDDLLGQYEECAKCGLRRYKDFRCKWWQALPLIDREWIRGLRNVPRIKFSKPPIAHNGELQETLETQRILKHIRQSNKPKPGEIIYATPDLPRDLKGTGEILDRLGSNCRFTISDVQEPLEALNGVRNIDKDDEILKRCPNGHLQKGGNYCMKCGEKLLTECSHCGEEFPWTKLSREAKKELEQELNSEK